MPSIHTFLDPRQEEITKRSIMMLEVWRMELYVLQIHTCTCDARGYHQLKEVLISLDL